MFGYVNRSNLVDVDDVAAGHLQAAEKGRVGERYILGGENLSLKAMLDLLADVSGLPEVRLRIPHGVALAWSYLDVFLSRIFPGRLPAATPDKVRLAYHYEFFDSLKHELTYPTPVRSACRKQSIGTVKMDMHLRDNKPFATAPIKMQMNLRVHFLYPSKSS
jgi:dihydroflavonol-4-reductase